jgi:hypothetical protein
LNNHRRTRLNPFSAFALTLLALITVYSIGKYVHGLIYGFRDPLAPDGAPSGAVSPAPPVASPQPVGAPVPPRHASGDRDAWKDFSGRFGAELKASRDERGKLMAIRGAPGSGERAGTGYSPEDEAQVRLRAREILAAAAGLLELEADSGLGEPRVRTGPVSAQAWFPQRVDGLEVEPAGGVTVDLGSQGELLNLSSDYVPGVQVTNQRSLVPDQARARAEAAVPGESGSLPTVGGKPVIWVTRSGPGGAPVGRQAYDFNVAGRQVVVDAGDGEILFKRDRRQF